MRSQLIRNYVKASSSWTLTADRIQVGVLTAGGTLMFVSLGASFIAAASTSPGSEDRSSAWWIPGYVIGLGTVVVNSIILLCRRARAKKDPEGHTTRSIVTVPQPPVGTPANATSTAAETCKKLDPLHR